MNTPEYLSIIENIKSEIKAAQYRAAVHANADILLLYHDIGCVINEHKAWGNKFVDNLATDIRIAFPESKGYSVRNLKYMAKFAETYPDREFVQTVSAQIPWSHNIAILEKVKDPKQRVWYIQKTAENGWSHNVGMKKGKINLAGAMPNALYIPSILAERNIFTLVRGKIKDIEPVFSFTKKDGNCCVSCGSSTDLRMVPSNSIDYIFVDPPFGDNEHRSSCI